MRGDTGREGGRHGPRARPQLSGGVYGSCYDCHENRAPSGYRCNQCDAAEFGINQRVLGHSNQRGSGTLAIKCVGVKVPKVLLSSHSYTSPALEFELISTVCYIDFLMVGRVFGSLVAQKALTKCDEPFLHFFDIL